MKAFIFAAGLALLAFAGVGGSDHGCNGNVTDVGGVLYIDDRDFLTGGLWIYAESNGTPGLQSGGIGALDPIGAATGTFSSVDTCNHPNPDLLIF